MSTDFDGLFESLDYAVYKVERHEKIIAELSEKIDNLEKTIKLISIRNQLIEQNLYRLFPGIHIESDTFIDMELLREHLDLKNKEKEK